jgi:hypothetical protein
MQIMWSEKALFTLILVVFVSLLCASTLQLGQIARLIPLKVVIPTLTLLLVQFLLDLIPPWAQKYREWEQIDLFHLERFRDRVQTQTLPYAPEATAGVPRGHRERHVFYWILLFLFLLSLYVKHGSDEGWLLSIGMAVGVGSFVYVIFALLLGAHLYEGQLWGWLGL